LRVFRFRLMIVLLATPAVDGPRISTMTKRRQAPSPTQAQIDDESRRIRRLRILVQLTMESIAEGDLSPEEAAEMIAATRRFALKLFPGKGRAFDLLYRPKFQRVMHAVYRLQ